MFYNPDQDDKDELWASKKLHIDKDQQLVPKKSVKQTNTNPTVKNLHALKPKTKSTKKPQAQAQTKTKSRNVLTCPGCFTNLCYQSQRHEKYPEQYRAIFVENCKVDKSVIEMGGCFGVFCAVCGARVGVIDEDQVYHFYGVLDSY